MNEFIRWEPFEYYEEKQFEQFVLQHHARILEVLNQITPDKSVAEALAAEIVMGHFFSDIPEGMTFHKAFELWCNQEPSTVV